MVAPPPPKNCCYCHPSSTSTSSSSLLKTTTHEIIIILSYCFSSAKPQYPFAGSSTTNVPLPSPSTTADFDSELKKSRNQLKREAKRAVHGPWIWLPCLLPKLNASLEWLLWTKLCSKLSCWLRD
nr:uncharacterized protein LOC112776940 [Arachis hypogaea]